MKKWWLLFILFFYTPLFAAEKLTIVLDWFLNPDHAPLIVAEQQGFFKEENLSVEFISPTDPSDPAKLVSAYKADIGVSYEPQLIEQIDRGLPLIRIATLINKPLDCMIVLKNSSIKSISDLKNKRIAYSTGGASMIALDIMLAHNGLRPNDVKKMNVNFNLIQALLSKKVDAISGVMRTFEMIQLDLNGQPSIAFLPEKNGVPFYDELILITNKNHLQDKKLIRFLKALEKATAYLKKHPKETWNQFAKTYPESNNELNKRAWFATIPYFENHPSTYHTKEWENFIIFMHNIGAIKKINPVTKYAIRIN